MRVCFVHGCACPGYLFACMQTSVHEVNTYWSKCSGFEHLVVVVRRCLHAFVCAWLAHASVLCARVRVSRFPFRLHANTCSYSEHLVAISVLGLNTCS